MNHIQKLPVLFAILAIAGLATAGYFYFQYAQSQKQIQELKTNASNTKSSSNEEAQRVVKELSNLLALPESETPTVATVTDIEKLKDQPFFAKAKNGDKVVIYSNSKKAILYDPQAKKVIDVAPVNIGSGSAQPADSAKITAKVDIKNGTTVGGLANRGEETLKKAFPGLSIVAKGNASKQDYDKTVVASVTDGGKAAAEAIAQTLGVSVTSLPTGESANSGAEVVVILGKDRAGG